MAGAEDESKAFKAAQQALRFVTQAIDLLDAHAKLPEATSYLSLAQEEIRQYLAR